MSMLPTVDPDLHCRQCGYALAGLAPDALCPECGVDVAGSITSHLVDFDAPCVKCTYSLLGLDQRGACPECGTPVVRSVHGALLRFSSAEYLATLHRGVTLVLASILLIVLQFLFALAFGMFRAITPRGAPASEVIFAGVSLLVSCVGLFGWWLLTTPDPRFAGQKSGRGSRAVVRVLVVIIAALAVTNFVTTLAPATAVPANAPTAGLTIAGAGLIALATFVAQVSKYFASLVYVGWLSRRIPHRKAQKRAGTLMWLGPVLIVFGSIVFFLGPVVLLVLYYNMLSWVRRGVGRARAHAEGRLAR